MLDGQPLYQEYFGFYKMNFAVTNQLSDSNFWIVWIKNINILFKSDNTKFESDRPGIIYKVSLRQLCTALNGG